MKNQIAKILPGSIAEEIELEVGDRLISINGNAVIDIIDYKFLITDELLDIEIEKADGEIWEIEVEKDYDEDLGIQFIDAILDKPKSCHNKCIFCFIDQLPEGMRETLYFKDDDSRLSFFQGNFVTLTNMKEEDIDRIIKYKISPINVSVHTTDAELRKIMLNNRFAGNVYDRLKRLAEAGIKINCQVVSCPGINNGKELIKTIEDLYKLYPSIENLAVVPVGITKYREGLFNLTLYDKDTAAQEILGVKELQEKYIREIGSPFIRLSDEFYVTAEMDVPGEEFYDGYEQLEDGIGMIRLLRSVIEEDVAKLKPSNRGSFTFITGQSAYEEILKVAEKITAYNSKINIYVKKIVNDFFGETITVAGLLTGKDIINQLKDEELGEYLIIPSNMLKKGYELGNYEEQIFLDNITVSELEKNLNTKVLICDYSGEDLIHIINVNSREEE
jgi:putative radical SAM enzyme (TIGR03279 family)